MEEADEEGEEDEGDLEEDGASKEEGGVGREAVMGSADTGRPLGCGGATAHTTPTAGELAPPPASGAGPQFVSNQTQQQQQQQENQQQVEGDVTAGVVSYIRSHFRIGPGYDREERRMRAPTLQHPHPQVFGLGMLGGVGGGDGGAGVRAAGGGSHVDGADDAAGECGTEGRQQGAAEAAAMEVEGGRLSEQESGEDQEPERRGRGRAVVGGDGARRKGKVRDSRGRGGADGYGGGGGGGGGAAGVIGRTAQQEKRAGKKAAKEARRQQRWEGQQQQGPRVRQMRGCSVEEPVGPAGGGGEGLGGGGGVAPADLSYDFASFERFTSGGYR